MIIFRYLRRLTGQFSAKQTHAKYGLCFSKRLGPNLKVLTGQLLKDVHMKYFPLFAYRQAAPFISTHSIEITKKGYGKKWRIPTFITTSLVQPHQNVLNRTNSLLKGYSPSWKSAKKEMDSQIKVGLLSWRIPVNQLNNNWMKVKQCLQ